MRELKPYIKKIFSTHLKLCLANANHNLKWVENILFNIRADIFKYWGLNTDFVSDNNDLIV